MRHLLFVLIACLPVAAQAQNKTWTTNADFDLGALTQVAHVPADQLQLGPTLVSKSTVVWACHTASAMVVKLDTNTGKQLGRYDSALQFVNGIATGAQPEFGANWPRRVAVDNNGDAWIPNAAFGGQGTLTKFSGSLSHCIDRNHNGKIDTSVDANGDGIIDTTDPKEFFGQNDECLITTIPVGGPNAYLRGVAVDRNGKIWVSENNCVNNGGVCRVFRFNPAEPLQLEATINLAGNPYSLSSGGQYVFVGNAGGGIAQRIDIESLKVDLLNGCPGFYGALAAHPSGDRAYFGNYGGGFTKADFKNNTCTVIPGPTATSTISIDQQGNVWGAYYGGATVVKMSPNEVILGTYPIPCAAHGVSVDFTGFVWLSGYGCQNMMKVDPANGNVLGSYTYAGPGNYNYWSYLYSDFTGYQINRQAPYMRFGNWSATLDGGVKQIPWSKVSFNTELQGVVPVGTTLKLYVRAADDPNALLAVGYSPVSSGASLMGAIVGRYVQVEADFTGPGYATAVLSDVTVNGACAVRGDACCLTVGDCNSNNLCVADSCPAPGSACVHVKTNGCCNVNGDCATGNLCSIDTCSGAGGTCTHKMKLGCCNVSQDCGDGNLCTQDVCSGAGGTCSNPIIPGCCNANLDCASGNLCSIDLCSAPGGSCSHFAKASCCNVAGDCDDANACTADSCPVAGGMCKHAAIVGCCNVDGDCDDLNLCNTHACTGPGGSCTYKAVAGCCNVGSDCDDKNACTADICSGAGGTCSHKGIVGCCNSNSDCDDKNACTADTCSGPGGVCTNAKIDGCCNVDKDCDTKDACVVDRCPGPGGKCTHLPKGAGCCTVDVDCDDKNLCTSDSCAMGAMCKHDPVPGCCNGDGDCPGAFCVEHACTKMPPSTSDGGHLNIAATGGCGCDVGQSSSRSPAAPALALLFIAALVLRRRRS